MKRELADYPALQSQIQIDLSEVLRLRLKYSLCKVVNFRYKVLRPRH